MAKRSSERKKNAAGVRKLKSKVIPLKNKTDSGVSWSLYVGDNFAKIKEVLR